MLYTCLLNKGLALPIGSPIQQCELPWLTDKSAHATKLNAPTFYNSEKWWPNTPREADFSPGCVARTRDRAFLYSVNQYANENGTAIAKLGSNVGIYHETIPFVGIGNGNRKPGQNDDDYRRLIDLGIQGGATWTAVSAYVTSHTAQEASDYTAALIDDMRPAFGHVKVFIAPWHAAGKKVLAVPVNVLKAQRDRCAIEGVDCVIWGSGMTEDAAKAVVAALS